jgi:hypothetical protein
MEPVCEPAPPTRLWQLIPVVPVQQRLAPPESVKYHIFLVMLLSDIFTKRTYISLQSDLQDIGTRAT